MWLFQFRFQKRISHKIFTPFAHFAILSATQFFFLEKTPKANLCTFFGGIFNFELGILSNIWRGIFDSALGINEGYRFLVSRVRKSENFHRYLEYKCGYFNFDLQNVFLTRYSLRLPSRFFRQHIIYFSEKHKRLTPLYFFRRNFLNSNWA